MRLFGSILFLLQRLEFESHLVISYSQSEHLSVPVDWDRKGVAELHNAPAQRG